MTIGRVFHYTPLVDDLPKAEVFFQTFFSPHCFYRGYAPGFHRTAAIYVIGEFVVEPLQPMPPGEGQEPSSWYRYLQRYGERVLNLSFYADDLRGLEKADPVVVAQGLHAEEGHPGEVADRQRAGHAPSLNPPLVGESTQP